MNQFVNSLHLDIVVSKTKGLARAQLRTGPLVFVRLPEGKTQSTSMIAVFGSIVRTTYRTSYLDDSRWNRVQPLSCVYWTYTWAFFLSIRRWRVPPSIPSKK